MAWRRMLAFLQTLFGVAKHELLSVLILLVGALSAVLWEQFAPTDGVPRYDTELQGLIAKELDSAAYRQQKMYSGVSEDGKSLLPESDSVHYQNPGRKKKELPAGKVRLNTATKAELMQLPGVGESTAEKIIAYRKEQPFRNAADIMNVKGIGEKKFEKMKPFLTAP